jgi:hypothetical protein
MTEASPLALEPPPRPPLIAPLIGLWLVMLVGGGLIGGYGLPRCIATLPPEIFLAAAVFAALAAMLARRRGLTLPWQLTLALGYGVLAWFTIAFAILAGNFMVSGLCKLF